MSNYLNGKAQSSLLILVSLVALTMIFWVTLNFLNTSSQGRILEQIKLSKISNYLDVVKGFSKESSLLASYSASHFVASQGGDNDRSGLVRNWICNSDVSPTVNEVRFFLGEETLNQANTYFGNLNIQDLPTLLVRNFTCANIDVSESSVFGKQNDEKFDAALFGSFISTVLKNESTNSTNDVVVSVEQDRFWYLYRIFKEWSRTTSFPSEICKCLSTICSCGTFYPGGQCLTTCPAFNTCAQQAVNKAVGELTRLFNKDPFIKCQGTINCCYTQNPACFATGFPGCSGWTDAPDCALCDTVPAGQLCAAEITGKKVAESGDESLLPPSTSGDYLNAEQRALPPGKDYSEPRAAVRSVFSCTDKKYALSVGGEDTKRFLTFSVGATVALKHPFGCQLPAGSCPSLINPLAGTSTQ